MRPRDTVDPETNIDRTHRTYIDYIERTRAHYLREGFGNPYAWSHFDDVPFTPLTKPLSASRVGLISTAAPYQPDKGDQGPYAPYNNDAKFDYVYEMPYNPVPDLRISHIGYDPPTRCPKISMPIFPASRCYMRSHPAALAASPRASTVPPPPAASARRLSATRPRS